MLPHTKPGQYAVVSFLVQIHAKDIKCPALPGVTLPIDVIK